MKRISAFTLVAALGSFKLSLEVLQAGGVWTLSFEARGGELLTGAAEVNEVSGQPKLGHLIGRGEFDSIIGGNRADRVRAARSATRPDHTPEKCQRHQADFHHTPSGDGDSGRGCSMEVVAVVVVLLAVSTALMVKPDRSGSPRNRRKNMGVATLAEESLRDRLQRRLKTKQDHHRDQLSQWDEAFYAQLSPAEYPEFLEPTALDLKGESSVERNADGWKTARNTTWWTPDKRAYTIRKTYGPYSITHGGYIEDITAKWLGIKHERKVQRRLTSGLNRWPFDEASPPKTADLSHIPMEELSRFYSAAELADPQHLSLDRFEWLHDSTQPGNCIGCGRFKKKLSFGYYACRDEYFRNGIWRHKFWILCKNFCNLCKKGRFNAKEEASQVSGVWP